MALLIVFLVFSIGFSFYCSVAEAVLLSISPSFIETLRKSKPKAAAVMAELKANIDRPLAAILSLNTIAHTIGAAGVGAQAAKVWDNSNAVGIAGAIMTLLILVFSEIIPKTIGALYWRQLCPFVAKTVRILIYMLYPLVRFSEVLTKLLSGGKSHHTLSREELGAMAQIGAQQGIIQESESRVFEGLIRLPEVTVGDVMTPRVVLVGFDQQTTVDEALKSESIRPVSRLPIYQDKMDNLTGFVLKLDLLLAASKGDGDKPLADFRRDIETVDREMGLSKLMGQMLDSRQHIAMVADRYGTTVGVVTLEDVVETLLGLEIVDERDAEVDLQDLARKKWRERAGRQGLNVDEDDSK